MTLLIWDWALVFFLAVFMPVWGWFDYRAFVKRAESSTGDVLSGEYLKTILIHTGMAGATLALWAVLNREWATLGFAGTQLLSYYGSGVILFAAVLIVSVLNLFAVMSGTAGDKARMEAYGQTGHFLPKTRKQHTWAMAVSVSAGIGEEIAYRGFMMWLLALFMPFYAVLIVQALVFGLVHSYQGVSGIIGTSLVGAVLGLIYILTGSLILPIILHILIDAVSLTAAYIVLKRQPVNTGDPGADA